MPRWNRFVKNKNVDKEKRLTQIMRYSRDMLDYLELGLNNSVLVCKTEPKLEQVAYGAIYRCNTCLRSMVELVNNGFIGSANALLRQCYEYLCWAKLAIDNCDDEILVRLHNSFYRKTLEGRADELIWFFKKINYEIGISNLTPKQIREEGKHICSSYAFLTHATSFSQQYPKKVDEIYKIIDSCLGETIMWLNCMCEVELLFIRKCFDYRCNGDEWNSFIKYGTYVAFSEKILGKKSRICNFYPGVDETLINKIFKNTKWRLEV